jgi:uncharacterized UBP type Zn finger protein
MSHPIPIVAKKYFWGDNLSDLSWPKHKKYIVQTLLERGNTSSLRWLFQHITREEVKKMLPTLRLPKKSNNFWGVYLS